MAAIPLLELQPGERVLILGVGTGADLPLLPAGVEATDINFRLGDLTRGCPCAVTHDEPGIAGGVYRVIMLKKK